MPINTGMSVQVSLPSSVVEWRTTKMPLVKNRSTEQNRRFWSHVEEIAREAEALASRQSREPREDSSRAERQLERSSQGGIQVTFFEWVWQWLESRDIDQRKP